MLEHFDERAADLPAQLSNLARRIFVRDDMTSSFTGSRQDCDRFWTLAKNDMTLGEDPDRVAALQIPEPRILNEAFIVPTDVCFVAKADDGSHTQTKYSGAWEVASRAMSYGYLWDEVRVQGGAYGCGFRTRIDGTMGYYTYRDPNLDATLHRLDGASAWLSSFEPTEQELTGYVVSTVAGHDAPAKPRALAARQDADLLAHRDPNWRSRTRHEELTCSTADLQALAPALDRLATRNAICVFGSKSIIESSSADLHIVDLLGQEE